MDCPRTPAELPTELLHNPRVSAALAHRDFTTVFAAASAAGVSYNRIAEGTGMKPERVSRVARGLARVTSLDTVERIADGLRIPGAMLGLAGRPWEGPKATCVLDNGDDPMKRRQLLRTALAAGLTGTVLTEASEARQNLDHALTPGADPADLAHLEAVAEGHAYGYRGRMPSTVLGNLLDDFTAVRALLTSRQTVAARARTTRIAGQMAGMTAVVLHDLGVRPEARAWFRTASLAADEAGDQRLHAWILAREAMVPLNFGAPRQATTLAARARSLAGDSPTAVRALATAVSARAWAASGHRENAREALAETERISDTLSEREREDHWFGYSRQKHCVHLSQCLTTLGDTARARRAQREAMALSAPTSTMTRALLRLDAATCQHHDGDSAGACRDAAAVLHTLPDVLRTGLARTRALELYRAVSPAHAEPAHRELREALALPRPRTAPPGG